MALLLLAAAARPGDIEAATVDHALRIDSAGEAVQVASTSAKLGAMHSVLTVQWPAIPVSNIQAAARQQRYELLGRWAKQRGLAAIATAHHADDQAETLLMRIARGAGIGGLGGIRPVRHLENGAALIRPLLGWRRADLRRIVDDADLEPVNDPANADDRFDRTAARKLLASMDWLDPMRLAASASHCRDADDALAWAMAREWEARVVREGDMLLLRTEGLPRELKRRLLASAMTRLGAPEPAGPDLMSALHRLEGGEVTTLAGLKLEGGATWRISMAPPRRTQLA